MKSTRYFYEKTFAGLLSCGKLSQPERSGLVLGSAPASVCRIVYPILRLYTGSGMGALVDVIRAAGFESGPPALAFNGPAGTSPACAVGSGDESPTGGRLAKYFRRSRR